MDNFLLGSVAKAVSKSTLGRLTTFKNGTSKHDGTKEPLIDVNKNTANQQLNQKSLENDFQQTDTDSWAGHQKANENEQVDENVTQSKQPVLSRQEFERLCTQLGEFELPDRGDTDTARASWSVRRRFNVKLSGLVLENLGKTNIASVFLIITFGGTATDVRVRDAVTKRTYPRTAGYSGERFISPAVQAPANVPVDVPFRISYEWRGSYLHLEKEHFIIEIWEYRTALNHLLCRQKEPLRNFVDTSVARTTVLEGSIKNNNQETSFQQTFRLSFQMEFQEIYDYELNFYQFHIGFPSSLNSQAQQHTQKLSPGVDHSQHFISHEEDKKIIQPTMLVNLFKEFKANPTISIHMPPSVFNPWPTKASSEPCRNPLRDFQKFAGTLIFRGTSSHLEAAEFIIKIRDSSKSVLRHRKEYHAVVPMHNVIGTPEFSSLLLDEKNQAVASISGMCGIPYTPRYKQTGQVLDIDDKHVYLFIKILHADQLPCTMNIVDSFVEVQYNGQTKQSTRVLSSVHPHYQNELAFAIKVADINLLDPIELESIGPAVIDLWCGTIDRQCHLGCSYLYLADIIRDSYGDERRMETKMYFDRKQNKEVTYETRTYAASQKLVLPSQEGLSITLFLEAWTKPDLGNLPLKHGPRLSPTPSIAPQLEPHFAELLKPWDKILTSKRHGKCDFTCLAMDHRGNLLPYNAFLCPLHPLLNISTPYECFNFVRSIPFVEPAKGDFFNASSFDFFLRSRQGTPFLHNLLLASLFIGRALRSYVCIGTRADDGSLYSCVLTIEEKPSQSTEKKIIALLWDPLNSTIYNLSTNLVQILEHHPTVDHDTTNNTNIANIAFTNREKKSGHFNTALSIVTTTQECPLGNIDIIFDNRQIYANIHSTELNKSAIDFSNNELWLKFYLYEDDIIEYPFSRGLTLAAPDTLYATKIRQTLYNDLTQWIQTARFQMSKTAVTQWVRPRTLTLLLECGASLLGSLERLDPNSVESQDTQKTLDKWRTALLLQTPPNYKLRWLHTIFNYANGKRIAKDLWDSVGFLREIDRSLLLSLGIHVHPLPGDFLQTIILVVCVSRLRDGRLLR